MYAQVANSSHVYGYNNSTDASQVDPDILALHQLATHWEENGIRKPKKLVLFGGVHGYDPTGIPTGEVGGGSYSFKQQDIANKRGFTAINFTYFTLFKYIDAQGEISPERVEEIKKDIMLLDEKGESIILLTWCFSRTWARTFTR